MPLLLPLLSARTLLLVRIAAALALTLYSSHLGISPNSTADTDSASHTVESSRRPSWRATQATTAQVGHQGDVGGRGERKRQQVSSWCR